MTIQHTQLASSTRLAWPQLITLSHGVTRILGLGNESVFYPQGGRFYPHHDHGGPCTLRLFTSCFLSLVGFVSVDKKWRRIVFLKSSTIRRRHNQTVNVSWTCLSCLVKGRTVLERTSLLIFTSRTSIKALSTCNFKLFY
ncbi:hypothetical protein CPAR01_06355 [Colletotrichum paranaense]|uniref:Uncharacterized protein n=1 Tax=Colletotrichum paranaense TaxID=1914294 RepID=A0ABQ9SMT9_9PEZI|nr:uncharacterized protein CPAR01_06355 [Colletotrichum paranaense]KAK1540366.1 hypothetical protein CPAR01_06355 [Colletotrichum paranaense]